MPTLLLAFLTIRGNPIAVVRIVVVQITVRIHVANVVTVPGVRGKHISYNRQPYTIYLYLFSSDLFQFLRRFWTLTTSPVQ